MKDVRCDQLFNSKILNMAINFYEWPSLNHDNERCFSPFNDSMFNIRFAYPMLFKAKYDQDQIRARLEEKLRRD